MKQTIKLTESQLHQLIRESVKGMLTELRKLDWKTYANAAKKAREQGRDSAYDLNKKANDELNKKYGGGHHWSIEPSEEGVYQRFGKWANGNELWTGWRPMEGHEDFGTFADFGTKQKYVPNVGIICEPEDDEKEVRDFINGKYEYVDGEGWKLKDDEKLNEAIKRSIRKYLH